MLFLWASVFIFPLSIVSLVIPKRDNQYRPVVIIHGILDRATSLTDLKLQIENAHPGTPVHLIPMFENMKSAWPMWTQVQAFSLAIKNISDQYESGINIIGYSQGGLIARGVIETTLGLNVHTFISLSSPQLGQYGDTSYLRYLFPNYLKGNLYHLLYSRYGQTFSVGGYWKDPHHLDLYQKSSQYLAVINQETLNLDPRMPLFRKNFLNIKKLVLIGGPDDGVITPWQSAHFGFFDQDDSVIDMKQQYVYINDPFGLRTLDKRGDLVILTMPNITHTKWHSDPRVFTQLIEPWLT